MYMIVKGCTEVFEIRAFKHEPFFFFPWGEGGGGAYKSYVTVCTILHVQGESNPF